MHTAHIDTNIKHWLAPVQKHLLRELERSSSLKQASLLFVHLLGTALMLSAPLTLVFAAGSALSLLNRVQGPLDWFVVEVLGAVCLLSAYLSYQLFKLKPAQPQGVRVNQADATALHEMLKRRAGHFKLRKVDNILLTTEAELRIVAAPRLPVPFYHSRTLCTGAPLMLFLNRTQYSLALAGAVAASAAEQSRLRGWMAQASNDWPLILDTLHTSNSLLSRLLRRPMQWVVSATQALEEEQQSDWRLQQGQWILDNSDEANAGAFLASQIVATAFLNKQYWPMILKAAERCPVPVVKAFSHLPLLLSKTLNPCQAERWLVHAQTAGQQQLNGVRDLLAELRIDHLSWPGLPQTSAFDELFSSSVALKKLDIFWQRAIEPEWRERHAHFQEDQIRFTQLQRRASETGLRGESALRYIKLAPYFLEMSETLSLYRSVYNHNRDDAKVCFAAGLAQLRAGAVDEGSHALQRAAELDPALSGRSSALIREHRQAWNDKEFGQSTPMQGACA